MDDWQVGDLALCIYPGSDHPTMRSGVVATVSEVHWSRGIRGLAFYGHRPRPGKIGFLASWFRKVTPPAADEFDREVIELMTGKPVTAQDNHNAPSLG